MIKSICIFSVFALVPMLLSGEAEQVEEARDKVALHSAYTAFGDVYCAFQVVDKREVNVSDSTHPFLEGRPRSFTLYRISVSSGISVSSPVEGSDSISLKPVGGDGHFVVFATFDSPELRFMESVKAGSNVILGLNRLDDSRRQRGHPLLPSANLEQIDPDLVRVANRRRAAIAKAYGFDIPSVLYSPCLPISALVTHSEAYNGMVCSLLSRQHYILLDHLLNSNELMRPAVQTLTFDTWLESVSVRAKAGDEIAIRGILHVFLILRAGFNRAVAWGDVTPVVKPDSDEVRLFQIDRAVRSLLTFPSVISHDEDEWSFTFYEGKWALTVTEKPLRIAPE